MDYDQRPDCPILKSMSTFIRKSLTQSGATSVQIITKTGRKVTGTDHIGSAHNQGELEFLVALANKRIHAGQLELELNLSENGIAGVVMEGAYSELLFDTLEDCYHRLGFGEIDDEVFKQLVLARIIEPSSKLDTIRILEELGLDAPSNTGIYRCLARAISQDYRGRLSVQCFRHASAKSLSLLLYDVTTLYFEVQKEDEYRKPGMSKERRLEPQITVGLLVDRDGFPLEIASFEGNRAEVKTIMEVLSTFKERYDLEEITVTADAAMLSSKNIQALEDAGYHYIIGSRIAKTPYQIAEYTKAEGVELTDGQIFDTCQGMNTGKGTARISRRVIYQYRSKRASLDLSNIDKALAKAERMVAGTVQFKRNRFLKVSGSKREINYDLVASSRLRAGIKGYVTDLDVAPQEIINAYHQLFEVERSFRMAKSDLKARPIFHHTRDSVEAHLTVVFAALAIARTIQQATGLTIKKFIRKLSIIRTGVISVNGNEYVIPPHISDEAKAILAKLGSR